MSKIEKKFPRTKVIERQNEKAREVLELDENELEKVRGGSAKYGLPPPPPDEILTRQS
jgi:hypothetical protein